MSHPAGGEELHEGGLAHAVGPYESVSPPLGDGQRGVLQQQLPLGSDRQLLDLWIISPRQAQRDSAGLAPPNVT
eukprot:scaffold220027_cov30-Prasinocladus_malaysianus.AAC.1